MLLALAETVWLSLARYLGYNAGMFDLGIMSQAIWSATQGQPLIFTADGIALSRLARHVELFCFVPSLFYALLPTPKTLLVFQAVLYVFAAWPLYALAYRRLTNTGIALSFVVMYLLYPVAQTAVLFDFHGDTLAMPLLFFALDALDRRAWRSYSLWLLLSLSCKFYVAAPVAALGTMLWLKGERKVGLVTALTAIAWGAIAFLLIRPLFAPPEAAQVRATATSYIRNFFGPFDELGSTADIRLLTGIIIYAPALWLAWRAPLWLLPASAIALPALLSTGPGPSFDYRYHHYALAVPFFLAAMIYGAETLLRRKRRSLPLHIGIALIITLMFNCLFVDSPLNLRFYNPPPGSANGLAPSRYGITARDAFKDAWLTRHVPPHAAIAADSLLSPHLTNRSTLYLTRHPRDTAARTLPDFLLELDYVVIDALLDFAVGSDGQVSVGGVLYEQESIRLLLQSPAFGLVQADDGLLLFERGADGLAQQVETIPLDRTPPLQARFGEAIGLVDARLEQLGRNHFHLTCDWVALSSLDGQRPLIAVSQLLGVKHARIVHLPTHSLLPALDWPTDHLIRERIEFVLPDEIPAGHYPFIVSWHDGTSLFAADTDERSRVGEAVEIGVLEIGD